MKAQNGLSPWGFLSLLILWFHTSEVSLWLRDLIRERAKKCSFVSLCVFLLGFILFVFSEGVLFVLFFWVSFHSIISPILIVQEALFLSDPSELTYGNTLLLSNAAVSLGSFYSSKDNLILFHSPHSTSFLILWCFVSLQVMEFRNLGFYVSDSLYGSLFYFLSGLHFFHVVIALVIIGIFISLLECYSGIYYLFIIYDIYFIIQVLYWHFVEVVWLFIILVIYTC